MRSRKAKTLARWLVRGLGLVTLLALWGPYITTSSPGGFYATREVRFGFFGYYRWETQFAVYGYFAEQQTFSFHLVPLLMTIGISVAMIGGMMWVGRIFRTSV